MATRSRIAESRVTSQGQVSVPAEVRRRLGVGPGSILEWQEEGGEVVVRRARRYSFADIHAELFPDGPPPPKTVAEMKAAVRDRVRRRLARR